MSERWRITIPVEGFDLKIKEKFELQNATVDTLLNDENKEEPMISINVDGDLDSARAKGTLLIDRVAARLSYSSEKEIRLKKEVYLTQLQPETGRQKKGWGYHEYRRTVTSRITMGDSHRSMVRMVMELENLKHEKQDIIDKAVAYYREALAAKNPFQQIITLFSCIQVIVRDVVGENEVQQHHICSVLGDYVKLQPKQCKHYYGRFRSAGGHGHIDILDPKEVLDAEKNAVEVLLITFRLIREYAKRNKQ